MVHLVFPALLVGKTKRGITAIPRSASIQFFWNMAASANTRVIVLERMLLKVLVITDSTPPISEVILVIISPWLFEVKNLCDIF